MEPNKKKIGSRLIDWTTAKKMILAYREHFQPIQVPVVNPVTQRLQNERLNGLKINADHMKEILQNVEGITDIFLIFGVRKEDLNKDEPNQFFTTIITGIANGKIDTKSAYDFCDPCPDKCGAVLDDVLTPQA